MQRRCFIYRWSSNHLAHHEYIVCRPSLLCTVYNTSLPSRPSSVVLCAVYISSRPRGVHSACFVNSSNAVVASSHHNRDRIEVKYIFRLPPCDNENDCLGYLPAIDHKRVKQWTFYIQVAREFDFHPMYCYSLLLFIVNILDASSSFDAINQQWGVVSGRLTERWQFLVGLLVHAFN